MTHAIDNSDVQSQAVEWFVRLQECDEESVWISHRDWLEADPAHAAAYAEVERTWVDLEDVQEEIEAKTVRPFATPHLGASERSVGGGRRWNWRYTWVPAAAAAAVVGFLVVPQIGPLSGQPDRYQTDAKHMQVVELEDGSKLTLNRNTRLEVDLGAGERRVRLASGEAAFDVHHDSKRPFVVKVGDREVRVLGTEFNIVNDRGAFSVAVRRGLVSVSRKNRPDEVVRLPAGRALTQSFDRRNDIVQSVQPDAAFAWQAGRLIYADRPLTDVANDLSRYAGVPVDVAPDLKDMRVTGVIGIGGEASLRRQLEALLPVRIKDVKGDRRLIVGTGQQ